MAREDKIVFFFFIPNIKLYLLSVCNFVGGFGGKFSNVASYEVIERLVVKFKVFFIFGRWLCFFATYACHAHVFVSMMAIRSTKLTLFCAFSHLKTLPKQATNYPYFTLNLDLFIQGKFSKENVRTNDINKENKY